MGLNRKEFFWSPVNGRRTRLKHWKALVFFSETVTSVFNEMGLAHEYKFYPWKRCEMLLANGKAFAAFPYAYTINRSKKYWFSKLITKADTQTEPTKLFFYKKNASDFQFQRLKDLKNIK
jgi:polar amino acid transport system substrate-binding protein